MSHHFQSRAATYGLALALANQAIAQPTPGSGPAPAWLRFDPMTTTFYGSVPLSLKGTTLHILVTARDAAGSEGTAYVTLNIY